MLAKAGGFFAVRFRRWLPDSFVFAILLTFATAIMAILFVNADPLSVVQSWYKGFWLLLEFGMQMVLILVTGYAIAISPPASRFIDRLSARIKKPAMVYAVVCITGGIFSIISWGWIVLTAVLARELAIRVRGVDYRLLAASVYASILPWHGGLSGTIPLVLNTPDNFLIKAGTLPSTIPTSVTIGSVMNMGCSLALLVTLPLLFVLMRPKGKAVVEFKDLRDTNHHVQGRSVSEEAASLRLNGKNLSDTLNHSVIIQIIIPLMGISFLSWHFYKRGFDINLNIMNFLFIMAGMICHRTPANYAVAMKRSCANISGIILQFPFYAGIMGMMTYTGLGKEMALWIAGTASVDSLPFVSFLISGLLNIFIPSGGGEWAVVGPTIVDAANTLGSGLPAAQLTAFIAKVSMSVAYGDAWTNMIQPFWTLTFFPIVAAGVRMQARDIMGYTFVALIWSFVIFSTCILFLPV